MAVLKKTKKIIREIKKKKITKKRIVDSILFRGRRKKALVGSKEHSLRKKALSILEKHESNPIMTPVRGSSWESEAVFNPGVVLSGGRVHLFYRALGRDGVSRVGYASSKDGIHFDERLPYPVFSIESKEELMKHYPYTSPARLVFNPTLYTSGGGWGGCEDPRAVKIGDQIYITFNVFNGWDSMRVAVTSINEKDLINKNWNWSKYSYLSRLGDRQKNWVLFPQKFHGKFAIFHNLDKGDPSHVAVTYVNKLDMSETPQGSDPDSEAPDPQRLPDHVVAWHNRTRSASAPPIKTSDGWLLFYHAMDKDDSGRYKVGALLLDLKDPTKVLYRSQYPLLQPDEWYENDYKPGIVYASGAVVKGDKLFIYYGGGDKHIAVAYVKLKDFIHKLKNKEQAVFTKKSVKVAS